MSFWKKNNERFDGILRKYFTFRNETRSIEPLAEVFDGVKEQKLSELNAFLKENPEIRANFSYYLQHLFEHKRFNLALTEANILTEDSFVPELKKRILNKVLPPLENENTVSYIVDNVLVTDSELRYFEHIDPKDSDELFRLLNLQNLIVQPSVKKELIFSMSMLSGRLTGTALEEEILKMAPEYRNFDNPFLALQQELALLNSEFEQNPDLLLHSREGLYKQIRVYLDHCFEFVNLAFKNSTKYGISGKINQELLKMQQQLQRIADILPLLAIDSDEDRLENSKLLIRNIIKYKSYRNNVKELIADSTTLLSHLITSHTAATGKHYITSTIREYMTMFWKAAGGGVIVGALCVLKMLFSYLQTSEFIHGFLYCFNYAMGFVMIYLMHFVLATKQPAMTAATMAKVLSEGDSSKKTYTDFAHLIAKLFRSQFISFVGNVILAFPVALAIIYGLEVLFQENLAADKSTALLTDLNPFESKAIFHACIAGFFLFISGIIAGNVGNNSVFYQIPQRIGANPYIRSVFGIKTARRLSSFYAQNWAGIISNVWFGIFMGSTHTIGKFLGLDLDIRHITFSAGNFALGLYGKGFSVSAATFWISLITVFLIGFMNFSVSFGLSMFLAFRSRKVTFGEVREITLEIFRYFFKNIPFFFLPIPSRLDEGARNLMNDSAKKPAEQ